MPTPDPARLSPAPCSFGLAPGAPPRTAAGTSLGIASICRAARATAAWARDRWAFVFGLTLMLMLGIGYFPVKVILLKDGKIQKIFQRWNKMTEAAADVARASPVNTTLAAIARVLVLIFLD